MGPGRNDRGHLLSLKRRYLPLGVANDNAEQRTVSLRNRPHGRRARIPRCGHEESLPSFSLGAEVLEEVNQPQLPEVLEAVRRAVEQLGDVGVGGEGGGGGGGGLNDGNGLGWKLELLVRSTGYLP